MNFEDYLRSITPTVVLSFAILALAMALLVYSQIQMSKVVKNQGKGKSR